MLVQCLLHQLAAKNYISDQQCAEFLSDVHNIAETARQDCDKNRSLEEEVWLVSFTVFRNTQIHTRLTALLTGIARVSCTLLQTDNHASTPLLSFLQAGCPSCRPTNSVKAL